MYKTGGFWADCNGAPAQNLKTAWESFCAHDVIDLAHLRGESWGWAPATFHPGRIWYPGTLGSEGMRHCVFRTKPMEDSGYKCDIKVDDYVRKVFYNGIDITRLVAGDLNRWDAVRRASFPPIPGAYVVVYGEDWKGDFFNKGGFWADCDTAPAKDLERSWESYCSTTELPIEYQQGEGVGWSKPTFRPDSHAGDEWQPGTLGDANKGHCAFRMIPVRIPTPEATTTMLAPATTTVALLPAQPSGAPMGTRTTLALATTTTEAPQPAAPALPEGWKAVWDPLHKAYYFWETTTDFTTWSVSEVTDKAKQEEEKAEAKRKQEEVKWNKPCKTQEECLKIVDAYLSNQPRQGNSLLRTYGPGSLDGGDCGELCEMTEPCPTDPLIPGCRYDTYDNSIAAIYLTKRGLVEEAKTILHSLAELLYPKSLDGIDAKLQHVGPSGKTVTLLAAAYSDVSKAKAGNYESDGIYDGAVDTGNNAWVALAFAHFAAATSSSCHASVARDILSALDSAAGNCGDTLSGLRGRLEPYPRNYRSTEHNIDVFAVATVLGDKVVSQRAHDFVHSMFGRNHAYNKSYSMGTGDAEEEKCSQSQPFGPVPADCTYWNLLADADPDRDRMAAALAFALRYPKVEECAKAEDPNNIYAQGMWTSDEDLIRYTGKKFYGTRFTTWGNGVQWEVTAGAAMSMLHFAKRYGALQSDGQPVELEHFVGQARDSIKLLLGMYKGVPGSVLGGNRDAWVKWTMKQDKWRRDVPFPGGTDTGVSWSYLRYNHVASTSWAGLLMLYQGESGEALNEDANPLAPPKQPMPQEDAKDCSCMGFGEPTEPPPTTPTAAPEEAEADFKLWQHWMHTRREAATGAAVPTGSEVLSVVATIKVTTFTHGSLGLDLVADTMTVAGVTDAAARAAGWRIGDRLVTMDEMGLSSVSDLNQRLALLAAAQQQDARPTASFKVLRMDLCGRSCQDIVHTLGKACSSTWADECPQTEVPKPFSARSLLSDLCPAECGESKVTGAWTHATKPGVETVLISQNQIHWQSGRVTLVEMEDSDGGSGQKVRTVFAGQIYHGVLFNNGSLHWSDGDVWLRVAGVQASQTTSLVGGAQEQQRSDTSDEAPTTDEWEAWKTEHEEKKDSEYTQWLVYKGRSGTSTGAGSPTHVLRKLELPVGRQRRGSRGPEEKFLVGRGGSVLSSSGAPLLSTVCVALFIGVALGLVAKVLRARRNTSSAASCVPSQALCGEMRRQEREQELSDPSATRSLLSRGETEDIIVE